MLLDMKLPDGNGIELWKNTDLPNTQLVFMTADSSVDSALEALRCGAVDYLLKPVSLLRLRGVLGALKTAPAQRLPSGAPASFAKRVGLSREVVRASWWASVWS